MINTATLALEEFVGCQMLKYVILSHRWGALADEVSYKDFLKGRKKDSPGYRKVLDFCALARERELEWGWVDTCCIDKRSSAELSEAINSMFKWYADASICFVYLADVKTAGPMDAAGDANDADDGWKRSDWWFRGWTLQELIAPRRLLFLDQA